MPTDIFPDGSPLYDHGHRPDGTTWERPSADPTAPTAHLALLLARSPFDGHDGRTWERWEFAAWTHTGWLDLVAVTRTHGRRRERWERAVSELGWCRLVVDDDADRPSILDVGPTSHSSDALVAHFADLADAAAGAASGGHELVEAASSLVAQAREAFADMLLDGPVRDAAETHHQALLREWGVCDGRCGALGSHPGQMDVGMMLGRTNRLPTPTRRAPEALPVQLAMSASGDGSMVDTDHPDATPADVPPATEGDRVEVAVDEVSGVDRASGVLANGPDGAVVEEESRG